MSEKLTNKNFMVSDAELDRWEDQPHKINLSAIREVCRELMKRRELDAEYRAEIDRLREALQAIAARSKAGTGAGVLVTVTTLGKIAEQTLSQQETQNEPEGS